PASGSSRESFAHSGVSMDDPSCRQRVAREESGELSPIQAASPPRQPFLPDPSNLIGVPAKSSNVARYAVIGIVASHFRYQLGMLLGDRQMSVYPTPVSDRRQRAGITRLCRYLPHHVLTLPRLSPNVAEAEEDERCPARVRVVLAIWSVAAEIDEARLVGMERELVPCETLAQNFQNPLGILEVRERHHGSSSGEESHLSALTDPDVTLSRHPALTPQPPAARLVPTKQTVWGPVARCAPASASTLVLGV